MVAGGMDQEAVNFFVYLSKRPLTTKNLPYLDIQSKDTDIGEPYSMAILLERHHGLILNSACF